MFCFALLVVIQSVRLVSSEQKAKRDLDNVAISFKELYTNVYHELDVAFLELTEKVEKENEDGVSMLQIGSTNKVGKAGIYKLDETHQVNLNAEPVLSAIQESDMTVQERIKSKADVRAVFRQAEHAERLVQLSKQEIKAKNVESARITMNGLKAALRHF